MSTHGGWAPYGAGLPTPTLIVEAFGTFSAFVAFEDPDPAGEDLYSVFRSHADLMGWSSTSLPVQCSKLWGMNDAELTAGRDDGRIGWVQVGLDDGVGLSLALPSLLRCFGDALGRFGDVMLEAVQLIGTELRPIQSGDGKLGSSLNWFNAAPRTGAEAHVLIDAAELEGLDESELLERLDHRNTGPFFFGKASDPVVSAGLPPFPGSSPIALSVTMPEAAMDAIGWAVATLIEVAADDATDALTRLIVRAELRPDECMPPRRPR